MQAEVIKSEFIIRWGEVFGNILTKWWLILISAIIGVGLGFAWGAFTYTPMYESRAAYLVSYDGEGETVSQISSENNFVISILNNCIAIVQQNKFFNTLQEQEQITEWNQDKTEGDENYISASGLGGYISYAYSTSTTDRSTVITVSVTTESAEKSFCIINALTQENETMEEQFFAQYIKDNYTQKISQGLEFSLINEPEQARAAIEGSRRIFFSAVGGVACAVLCVGILFLIALADSRIKDNEDLSMKYNIPVLGTVPNFEESKLNRGGYHYGSQGKENKE